MPISKDRISPPVEAGPSILELKQLPPQLTSALGYVSSRLARKQVHLSMIVVRKDIEIFSALSSPDSSKAHPSTNSVTSSPARSLFEIAGSTISKTLSKHSSNASLSDSASSASSSASSTPSSATFSRSKWPGLPTSPKDSISKQNISEPLSYTSQPCSPTSMNPFGITMLQTTALTQKTEKILRRTVQKAEKKFGIGSGWLTSHSMMSLPTCPHTLDLITHSLVQNDVLFTQDGLTLLSLDHLYTFKSALHIYSRTLSPVDLTSSVDSLRRLVLCRRGENVKKNDLIKSYNWLGVSLAALVDVNEGYKTAYGGAKREGGVDMGFAERPAHSPKMHSPPKLGLKTNFNMTELRSMRCNIGGSLRSSSSSVSDGNESPVDKSSSTTVVGTASPIDKEVEVGESAKGRDDWGMRWSAQEDRGPHRRGPMTPNGFEDITPVTKGEWCFLMVGEGWREGRKMAVETC